MGDVVAWEGRRVKVEAAVTWGVSVLVWRKPALEKKRLKEWIGKGRDEGGRPAEVWGEKLLEG